MKRKILSAVLVLTIIISLVSLSFPGVSAADNKKYVDEGGAYYYRYYNNNQEVYIVNLSSGASGEELVIPAYIDGRPVTVIGDEACWANYATSLVLPETLKYIGANAFKDSEFTTVHIPASVTYIAPVAFSYCEKLTKFTVAEDNPVYTAKNGVIYSKDEKVLVMNPGAKYSVNIPEGVEYIYDYAFAHMEKRPFSVKFPSTLKGIGTGAFWNSGVSSVKFPEGLMYIEEDAFGKCNNLMVPVFPSTITYVGAGAFYGLASLPSYASVFNINHIAYKYSGSAKEISVDEHITAVAPECFSESSFLVKINIPASVDDIDPSAFTDCDRLTEIAVDENNKRYATYDGMLYTKDFTCLLDCPQGKEGDVTLHENTKYIMSEAFSWCNKITEIKIPESLEGIGYNAFEYCQALEKITIPQNCVSLGEDLFEGCKELIDIEINCKTTAVSDYDLYDTAWYENHKDGILNIGGNVMGYKNMYADTTKLSFDSSVKTIAETAFMGYYNLEEVVLPQNLEMVGFWAFGNCTGLESITVPPTVTEIGEYAFGYLYEHDDITQETYIAPIEDFVIKGYTNSAADAYAREHNFKFVSLGVLDVTLLKGDTDFDNVVTIKDATLIQKYLADLVDFVSQQKKNADMNSDGDVNIKDATAIQKSIAGLEY